MGVVTVWPSLREWGVDTRRLFGAESPSRSAFWKSASNPGHPNRVLFCFITAKGREMLVTLTVTDGPQANESIRLTPGKTVTVGRSSESDFPITNDSAISRKHFQLSCTRTECQVKDLGSRGGTFLNESQVDVSVRVRSADELMAGHTRLVVKIDAETERATMAMSYTDDADLPEELVAERDDDGYLTVGVAELAARAELEEDAQKLVGNVDSNGAAIELLKQEQRFVDMMRFVAQALPKREAVWWASQCVKQLMPELSDADQGVLEAAETWCADPTDDNRRAASAAANGGELGTPSAWVAMGAAWSCGSMAPADAPVVPPGPEISGKAISGAVMSAVVSHEPQKAESRHKQCLAIAVDVVSGADLWV